MKRVFLLLQLALKGIRQNWRHSLATMLAILGGFAAVSLFDGFLAAIREFNEEHYVHKGMVGHVLIEKKGSHDHLFEDVWRYSLDEKEQALTAEILQNDPRVEASMRYLVVSGMISNGQNNALFLGAGYEEDQGQKIRGKKWEWNTVAGKPLFLSPKEGALMLGMGLASRLGCKYSPVIQQKADSSYLDQETPLECPGTDFQLSVTTEHSQVNALSLPATGVTDFQLREFNDKVLSMPLGAVQRLLDTTRITRFILVLRDRDMIPGFLADFRKQAEAKELDLEATKWIDHPVAAVSRGGLEVLSVFRGLFLAVVALIAAMSVANSMMKSINERIREIGTLRSFGFRRLDIVLLFSFEGMFLGLFSCVAGIFVTTFLAFLIKSLGFTFKAGVLSTPIPVGFSFAYPTWALTAGVLTLITFATSWIVARRAAKMVIADALRYTA